MTVTVVQLPFGETRVRNVNMVGFRYLEPLVTIDVTEPEYDP